jgi:hypothetical protein
VLKISLILIALILSCPGYATTLELNGSGEITGVNGLNIGSQTWNVSFVDGSCLSIDSNCTSTPYQSASNNLFNLFEDTLNTLMRWTYTRHDFESYQANDDQFLIYAITNFEGYPVPTVRALEVQGFVSSSPVFGFGLLQNIDPNANQDNIYTGAQGVFATFHEVPTQVPVPAGVWLFGASLLGLAGIKRQKLKTNRMNEM